MRHRQAFAPGDLLQQQLAVVIGVDIIQDPHEPLHSMADRLPCRLCHLLRREQAVQPGEYIRNQRKTIVFIARRLLNIAHRQLQALAHQTQAVFLTRNRLTQPG